MFNKSLLLLVILNCNFALIGSEKVEILKKIDNNEHLNFTDGLKKIPVFAVPALFFGISMIHAFVPAENLSYCKGFLIILGQMGSAAWAGTTLSELTTNQERRTAENERLREKLRKEK